MFANIASAFNKFFSKDRVLALILFLILAWALYSYSGSKSFVLDTLETGTAGPQLPNPNAPAPAPAPAPAAKTASDYVLQTVANPGDLLPKDKNSQWASSVGNGDMPDLLQAGYHIGLDTIGQSLRNPNLQLRSDPIIVKTDIGPWNISTMEPDYARPPLEVGEYAK